MNLKAVPLAIILGLATPMITETLIPTAVSAQSSPRGTFQDGTWLVSIDYSNNTFTYYGENKRNGDSIYLSGAVVSGNPQRRIYTWNNGGYRYRVAWRPSDPAWIRVQVISPNGQEILNRLLSRHFDI